MSFAQQVDPSGNALQNMTFMQRLRYNIVVSYLHKINLTSYNRLRRAYVVMDELRTTLTTIERERDEVATLLRTVAADRDRLAGQMQREAAERESLTTALRTTTAERDRLVSALHAADIERERQAGQVAISELKLEQLRTELQALRRGGESRQDADETISLPVTVKTGHAPSRAAEVDAYFAARQTDPQDKTDDALYYALEISFRGSEEDIRHRQSEYLPYLSIDAPELPVVDLGCGRGEFLELLREHGIRALGVDTNTHNIETLRRKGLEVYHQDALAYLENAAPNSLAAVTAFQVIEHVPTDYLRRLIGLAYEKLVPGGFILLETVNTYCLETFRTFYLDPTHRSPVPIDLLSLLLRFHRFSDNQLFLQNPIKPTVSVSNPEDWSALYQTYALMATKPHPDTNQAS